MTNGLSPSREPILVRLCIVNGAFAAGARRYVAIDGQPKYLTLYEFEHAGVSETAEWARARDSNPWSNRVRAFMRHDVGSPGVYRRLYPK